MKTRIPIMSTLLVLMLATACSTASQPATQELDPPQAEAQTQEPEISDAGPDSCQDRILVKVWRDLNGDGQQDSNELPVANARLMLVREEYSPDDRITAFTDANGEAYFAGFELDDCSPDGYAVMFGTQVDGYQFPNRPVVYLRDFDMLNDVVQFGLLPFPDANPENIFISAGPDTRVPGVIQVAVGETLEFYADIGDGRVEPTTEANVTWRVEPDTAAHIDDNGILTVDSSAEHDSRLTVIADAGEFEIETEVFVYDPAQNPYIGEWYEVEHINCPDQANVPEDNTLGEIVILADSSIYVTAYPFETYFDYRGRFGFQESDGFFVVDHVEQINDFPTNFDGEGYLEFDERGRLIMREVWLGGLSAFDFSAVGCGHILERR